MTYGPEEWGDDDFDTWYTDETGREIVRRLPRKVSAIRVLEIGCASGRMTAALARPGRMILACSLNEAMIKRARTRDLDGVRWVCGNVLDMKAMEFDAIVCASVLHEVPSPGSVMRKAHELLAPGGRIFVSVPSANSFHLTGDPSERSVRFGVRRLWSPGRWHEELISGTGLRVTQRFEMMAKPYPNEQMACLTPKVLDYLAGYRGPGGAICYFELESVV